MLHKQERAQVLVLATLFKIALPSKVRNLFSLSHIHTHLERARSHLQNTSVQHA